MFESDLSCWNVSFGRVVILSAFSPCLLSTEQTVLRSTDASYVDVLGEWMMEQFNSVILSLCDRRKKAVTGASESLWLKQLIFPTHEKTKQKKTTTTRETKAAT